MAEVQSINGYAVKDAFARSLISERKIVLLTDDYGIGSNEYSWLDRVDDKLNNKHTVIKVAKQGAAFYSDTVGNTFLNMLQTAATEPKDTVTDIIVLGGLNDADDSGLDLRVALEDFATYTASNYPHARVSVGCVAPVFDNATLNKKIADVVYPQYSQCARRGSVAYISGSEMFVRVRDQVSGNVLTTAGHTVVANHVLNFLINNTVCTDIKSAEYTAVKESGQDIAADYTITQWVKGGNVYLYIPSFTLKSTYTIESNSTYYIGAHYHAGLLKDSNPVIKHRLPVVVRETSGKHYNMMADFMVSGDSIAVMFDAVDANGAGLTISGGATVDVYAALCLDGLYY